MEGMRGAPVIYVALFSYDKQEAWTIVNHCGRTCIAGYI